MNTAPTWLTYAAASIAALGFLSACGSLAFQVLSWKRSGRRVDVMVVPGRTESKEPVLLVSVNSVGRQPVYIRSIGLDWVDEGLSFEKQIENATSTYPFDMDNFGTEDILSGPEWNQEIPAGHGELWNLRMTKQMLNHLPSRYKLWVRVVLGDGQQSKVVVKDTDIWHEADTVAIDV